MKKLSVALAASFTLALAAPAAAATLLVDTSGPTVQVSHQSSWRDHSDNRRAGRALYLKVSALQGHFWKRIALRVLTHRNSVLSFDRGALCGGAMGPRRVLIQTGLLGSNGWWWNGAWRRYQRAFSPLQQREVVIQCDPYAIPAPPPAPPTFASPPAPAPVTAPPPPQAVPDATFQRFLSELRGQGYDSRRVGMVGDWVSRLRGLRLTSNQASQILRVFGYDSKRVSAAQHLRGHLLPPVTAKGVASIVGSFGYDSKRAQAAIALCKGLSDPLNISDLTRIFGYESSRKKVRAACR